MTTIKKVEKSTFFFLPNLKFVKPDGAPKNYNTVAAESQEKIKEKINKNHTSQN